MLSGIATHARFVSGQVTPLLQEMQKTLGSAFSTSGTQGLIPFASGGIVTSPTPALIGEAGPEAIIPLDRLGSMGTTNISVTINATGDGEELGRLLVQSLRQQGVQFA